MFQQFVPETRNRQRADVRLDSRGEQERHRCSSAAATSTAIRTASPSKAGNALTNLPILDIASSTPASVIGGWTKIFSPTIVNEFRVGYNYDNSQRQSTFHAADVASTARHRERAEPDARSPRLPVVPVPRAGTNRPTNIADAGRNVDRTLGQNAFSLSDNLTLDQGRPLRSRRAASGRATWRATASGFGVNFRGQYRFNAARRPATRSPTSCSACPSDVRDQVTNRGPLDGHSNDFAGVRAGRLEGQQEPDGVPRPALRGRRRVAREQRHCWPTSSPDGRRPSRRAERGGGGASCRPG